MVQYYYIYVLKSEKDGKKYIGYTENLDQRLKAHNEGKVTRTKGRRPIEFKYFEGCKSMEDANRIQQYLRSENGFMFLSNRLKSYLHTPTDVNYTKRK